MSFPRRSSSRSSPPPYSGQAAAGGSDSRPRPLHTGDGELRRRGRRLRRRDGRGRYLGGPRCRRACYGGQRPAPRGLGLCVATVSLTLTAGGDCDDANPSSSRAPPSLQWRGRRLRRPRRRGDADCWAPRGRSCGDARGPRGGDLDLRRDLRLGAASTPAAPPVVLPGAGRDLQRPRRRLRRRDGRGRHRGLRRLLDGRRRRTGPAPARPCAIARRRPSLHRGGARRLRRLSTRRATPAPPRPATASTTTATGRPTTGFGWGRLQHRHGCVRVPGRPSASPTAARPPATRHPERRARRSATASTTTATARPTRTSPTRAPPATGRTPTSATRGRSPARRPGSCCGDHSADAPELCNGIDDDCDGVPTRASPTRGCGQACCGDGQRRRRLQNTGSGARCRTGAYDVLGGSAAACDGAVAKAAEICNGVDDDCDGATDDSGPRQRLHRGRRDHHRRLHRGAHAATACPARGPTACTCRSASAPGRDLQRRRRRLRRHDRRGARRAGCAAQAGVCAGAGATCGGAAGWLACCGGRATAPSYEANETRCDGLDNDCDGATDEAPRLPARRPDGRLRRLAGRPAAAPRAGSTARLRLRRLLRGRRDALRRHRQRLRRTADEPGCL